MSEHCAEGTEVGVGSGVPHREGVVCTGVQFRLRAIRREVFAGVNEDPLSEFEIITQSFLQFAG